MKRNRIFWISSIIVIGTILSFWSSTFADYRVLWDISHGGNPYIDYQPSGKFQPLVQNLAVHGFNVDTSIQGFLVDDPTGYDVLVVCLGSAFYSSYSSEEVNRIADFVNNGGGLLIMGDNPVVPNVDIQPVASAFGVTLGQSMILPYDTYTSNLASHPIFDGVNEIYMRAAGEISAVTFSNEVAWQEGTGKALVAVGAYGNGRVVTLGDINLWAETEYYDLVDNRIFSINTFEYLAIPEPSTLLMIGLGALFLRRKRR